MYMEIADMTLEQLSSITSLLGQARLGAYMGKVGMKTYLYAVNEIELKSALDSAAGFSYV